MADRQIVAIGVSEAGISAALRARELDPTAQFTVVVADAHPNFSICGIPYYVSGEVTRWTNMAHRTGRRPGRHRNAGPDRHPGHPNQRQRAHLRHPRPRRRPATTALRRIVGTGAVSTRPPIIGLTGPDALGPADGVHLLHSMGDTFAVMESLTTRNPKTAAIIGAGYIGLEMAEVLVTRGIAVT